MILGIDPGNHKVKVAGPFGVGDFHSDIGEYRQLKWDQKFGKDDMVWEYKGRKGFAGSLAKYESEYNGSMLGDTKAHEDTKLRVLLAVHNYSNDYRNKIVVGQPIENHTKEEKEKIKEMLIGRHTIKVNDIEKTFEISKVEVAAEDASAFWASPRNGLVRVVGFGSGTIGCGTLDDRKYIDKDSFSIKLGANTTKNLDLNAMARVVATKTHKWDKDDTVLLVGGLAEEMLNPMKEYYPKVEVMQPILRVSGTFQVLHPVYANAVAFYNIARNIYGA